MPNAMIPWFHSLTQSVAALGLAAREYGMAAQSARLAAWSVDSARLAVVPGTVSVRGRHYLSPYDDSVRQLSELHTEVERQIRDLYENAALAYAYGTAAVVTSVREGRCLSHVELGRIDGRYVIPKEPLPHFGGALDEWLGGPYLGLLRDIVIEHVRAKKEIRERDFFEDLADCESTQFAEVSELASGLADSAMTYGEHVERALHFVLVGAKENHTAVGDE
ncbi:hypothetical protein ACIA78_26830 [Streptomyces xanthochromogenes]|uniref:hypothetical protein n=1 Tax=Streptomyces xanthochromogenes TaxID=67384 RepID=UPI0037A80DCE